MYCFSRMAGIKKNADKPSPNIIDSNKFLNKNKLTFLKLILLKKMIKEINIGKKSNAITLWVSIRIARVKESKSEYFIFGFSI